jgi:hypothetical protein
MNDGSEVYMNLKSVRSWRLKKRLELNFLGILFFDRNDNDDGGGASTSSHRPVQRDPLATGTAAGRKIVSPTYEPRHLHRNPIITAAPTTNQLIITTLLRRFIHPSPASILSEQFNRRRVRRN